ncbi:hypothetical protein ACFL3G_09925 [Planctomycetota bacterium]
MLKKQMIKLKNQYGFWRLIHTILAMADVVLIVILVLELAVPIRLESETTNASNDTRMVSINNISEILQSDIKNIKPLLRAIKPGLFKASTPLRDKPIADRTLERIKSQLKLQCIMKMKGEPVAYINIKGSGLKKCKVGESVSDLFTVLNINKNSVEISIVDHKVILSL